MIDSRTALRLFENRYAERGRLFLLHLDLTWRCPLSCRHCYLEGGRDARELPTDDWLALMDEARAEELVQIVLSGGEPMLRGDFRTLLEGARQRGFAVLVKTTGIRLSDDDADRFAALRRVTVDVSLHSVDASVHDAFTGLDGSWRLAVRAIEALRARGVEVRIARSLVLGIPPDGGALQRWAAGRGCGFVESTALLPRRDGTPTGCGPLDEPVLVDTVLRHFDGRPTPVPREPDPAAPPCSAGGTRLHVDPSGVVSPCVAWPRRLGRWPDDRLGAIVSSDALARVRALRNADRTACIACGLRGTCEFCPGVAEAVSGDPAAPYPAACERATMFSHALARMRSREGEGT